MAHKTNKVCRWVYRPGTAGSHWAFTTCKKGFNLLSKIKGEESEVGCADVYNGRLCPICGRAIRIDYCIIQDTEEITNES